MFRNGAPDRIRTCDPWFRKPILYPAELRARCSFPARIVTHCPASRITKRRGRLRLNRDDDFAKLLVRLEVGVGLNDLVQREGFGDDGFEGAFAQSF